MFQTFYSIHASVWLLLVISFFITYFITKRKVPHIVLRVLYVVMLGTGISMLSLIGFPPTYVVKALLAFALVGVMETMIARKKKGKDTRSIWIVLIIVLVLILLMGFNVITL